MLFKGKREIINLIITISTIITHGYAQDTVQVRNQLIGNWNLLYEIEIDTNGLHTDTTSYVTHKSNPSLCITPYTVQEIWTPRNYSQDTITRTEKSNWYFSTDFKPEQLHISFNCNSIFLCGFYELSKITKDSLELKTYWKYEMEFCQKLILYKTDNHPKCIIKTNPEGYH